MFVGVCPSPASLYMCHCGVQDLHGVGLSLFCSKKAIVMANMQCARILQSMYLRQSSDCTN